MMAVEALNLAMSDVQPRQVGLGPRQGYQKAKMPSDTFLIEWTEWLPHVGRGLPVALIGQRIMLAGLAHDGLHELPQRFLTVTAAYAASEEAAVWDWSQGFGGVSAFRLKRRVPLNFGQDLVDSLNDGWGRLMFGLDGVAE